MPPELAEKLKNRIPDHAGLMTLEFHHIKIIKIAPVNHSSEKLTVKECVRLCRQMTVHMVGYALRKNSNNSAKDFDFADWIDAKKGTYQI